MTLLTSDIDPNRLEELENYWVDVAFYLSAGEQAPLKSAKEVFEMPISRVLRLVRKLNELYEKQEQERKKTSRK